MAAVVVDPGGVGADDVDPVNPIYWDGYTNAYVGKTASGALLVNSGSRITSRYGYIGYDTGSSGSVTVDGTDSTWTNSNVYVGGWGSGTLNITNGGSVKNNYNNGYISYESGSIGTVMVDGPDSTWTNHSLYVGHHGEGTLEITNGGTVGSSSGHIGYESGSTGTVTVDGTGSAWSNRYGVYIGYSGNDTLNITNGGTVSSSFGYVGHESGSTGTATVDGTDSSWTNSGILHVGNFGSGTLEITAGGAVSNTDGYLGDESGSTGIATVDGTGSTWTNNGYLYVGYDGSGELNISNEGSVLVAGITHVDGSQGTISFNNGTLDTGALLASNANLSGTGTINTHGVVTDEMLVLDSTDDLAKQYLVDSQPNQSITVNLNIDGQGCLGAGYLGTGSLTIKSGFAVESTDGHIGYESGSAGTVRVDGTGSTWTNRGNLCVGFHGSGTLAITAGGSVSNDSYGIIGSWSSSASTAIVDGTDSIWTNNTWLCVGSYRSGTLAITNGGAVSNSDDGYIGRFAGSTGTVTVDGTGSNWTNSSDLYVGRYGRGTLNITWDGLVSVGGTLIIDYNGGDDSFVNMAAGGMLALLGDAHDSIDDFLDLIDGTNAIRYWDESASDWAPIMSATPGTDYTLTYVNDAGSDLYQYTILTVLTTTIPCDANWDGAVNELDAAVLAANWCKSGGWSNGDFNHDGMVDAADASILAANWQQGTEESTTVPEPAVMAMLLGLTLVVLRRRRLRGLLS